jgi:hypothetical protein
MVIQPLVEDGEARNGRSERQERRLFDAVAVKF